MAIIKEDLPNTAGIYMIIHTDSQMFYIGSSLDFQSRWGQHFNSLRYKAHSNKKLQKLWNESRADDFEFVILECIDSPTQTLLIDAEIKWMKHHLVPSNPLALNPRLAFHKTESVWEENGNVLSEYFKGVLVKRTRFTTTE